MVEHEGRKTEGRGKREREKKRIFQQLTESVAFSELSKRNDVNVYGVDW